MVKLRLFSANPTLDVTNEDTKSDKTSEDCYNQRKIIREDSREVGRKSRENRRNG